VALLSGLVRGTNRETEEEVSEDHLAGGALAAIALTDDPAADRAFERFVAADAPAALRGHATFWLGAARGQPGFELLKRIVREDLSEHVREQAVFGLSVSKQPGSLQALIDVVHHGSSGVRGQAIFWLAQKAGRKATQAITAAIEDDPETEVKKRAVFALSQLPAEEGVPLLIKVAQTNRNPEIRRQAIFWLGQSKDPRAWAFIEDILMH
jgi:HEAT repeat protein